MLTELSHVIWCVMYNCLWMDIKPEHQQFVMLLLCYIVSTGDLHHHWHSHSCWQKSPLSTPVDSSSHARFQQQPFYPPYSNSFSHHQRLHSHFLNACRPTFLHLLCCSLHLTNPDLHHYFSLVDPGLCLPLGLAMSWSSPPISVVPLSCLSLVFCLCIWTLFQLSYPCYTSPSHGPSDRSSCHYPHQAFYVYLFSTFALSTVFQLQSHHHPYHNNHPVHPLNTHNVSNDLLCYNDVHNITLSISSCM